MWFTHILPSKSPLSISKSHTVPDMLCSQTNSKCVWVCMCRDRLFLAPLLQRTERVLRLCVLPPKLLCSSNDEKNFRNLRHRSPVPRKCPKTNEVSLKVKWNENTEGKVPLLRLKQRDREKKSPFRGELRRLIISSNPLCFFAFSRYCTALFF